ncbi:MAG: hypothetical protein OEV94_07220 [Deltaproteobacteria bacterium]|nr:hypothetical protein [Deltaproteobacteria bacterium]
MSLPLFCKYWMISSLLVLLAAVLNPTNQLVAEIFPRPEKPDVGGLLLMALGHGIALAWWLGHTPLRGWRLGVLVAGVYVGIGTVLTQLETWMFLSVWNPVITGWQVGIIAWHATVFGGMVGLFMGLAFRKPEETPHQTVSPREGKSLVGRMALTSVVYFLCYVLAGYYIAIPLGGDAFNQVYGNLRIPEWALPFQLMRGLGWAALVWVILRDFRGKPWEARLGVALVLTMVIDAGLLVKNGVFPDQLRMAHFTEIFVSMMVFGWLAAGLLMVKPAR